jgi:hypothetical protein
MLNESAKVINILQDINQRLQLEVLRKILRKGVKESCFGSKNVKL